MAEERTNDEKQIQDKEGVGVNLGRHQAQCTVCGHPQRQEIEEKWMDWGSAYRIEKQFGVSHDSIYRHAHALGLFSRREKNIKRALERIIERVDDTIINGSTIIAAISAYLKINSARQGTEQTQGTDIKSQTEGEAFARDGSLPEGFFNAMPETPGDTASAPAELAARREETVATSPEDKDGEN